MPRFYRGHLIGFVQREDVTGAMRMLDRLDRMVEGLAEESGIDALREKLEAFDRFTRARSDRNDGTRL